MEVEGITLLSTVLLNQTCCIIFYILLQNRQNVSQYSITETKQNGRFKPQLTRGFLLQNSIHINNINVQMETILYNTENWNVL